MTATENQRVQKNANLRLILGNKINQRGEKMFWELWYRSYKIYFPANGEKNIKLNNSTPSTLRKKDFITVKDIDIKVTNRMDLEERIEKNRISLIQNAQFILQDPSIPDISKRNYKREMLRTSPEGKNEDWVLDKVPETVDEMQAKLDLELLNRNEDV